MSSLTIWKEATDMSFGFRSVLLGAAVMLLGPGAAYAQTRISPPSTGAQPRSGMAQAAGADAQVGAGSTGAEAGVGAGTTGAGAEAQVGSGTTGAGAQVGAGPGGAQAGVGAGPVGAGVGVGATPTPGAAAQVGAGPVGAEAQVGAAPGMQMEGQAAAYPPMEWQAHRLIGGHIGAALPIATIAHDSEFIGDDFVDLGLSSGVAARINPCWSFDFEFIAYDALKSKRGPTRLLVDPGVFRAWGSFALGLRAGVMVGGPNVNNFGLIPVLYQHVPFSERSPAGMYLELDLPVFVNDAHENRVTFTPQVQVGASF